METEINMRILRMLVVLGVVVCPFAGVVRGQVVRCSSDDGRRQFCQADTRYGVTLVKQVSGAACQQGNVWIFIISSNPWSYSASACIRATCK